MKRSHRLLPVVPLTPRARFAQLLPEAFDKPIEATVIAVGSGRPVDSVNNSQDAELIGFEFEGRKDFGFVSRHLKNLSLLANVAYIDSTVNVGSGVTQVQTSTKRALQGQAPYIANAALDYTNARWGTARLLAGTRIARAGASGLPDLLGGAAQPARHHPDRAPAHSRSSAAEDDLDARSAQAGAAVADPRERCVVGIGRNLDLDAPRAPHVLRDRLHEIGGQVADAMDDARAHVPRPDD